MTGSEWVDYPLRIDARGATARTPRDDHLADLIEQVLFTAPGERVNRPDFGAGLNQLLFAPAGPEVATTTQLLVHGSLQQWLGDLIDVADVSVTSVESTILVEVSYTARIDGRPGAVRFAVDGGRS